MASSEGELSRTERQQRWTAIVDNLVVGSVLIPVGLIAAATWNEISIAMQSSPITQLEAWVDTVPGTFIAADAAVPVRSDLGGTVTHLEIATPLPVSQVSFLLKIASDIREQGSPKPIVFEVTGDVQAFDFSVRPSNFPHAGVATPVELHKLQAGRWRLENWIPEPETTVTIILFLRGQGQSAAIVSPDMTEKGMLRWAVTGGSVLAAILLFLCWFTLRVYRGAQRQIGKLETELRKMEQALTHIQNQEENRFKLKRNADEMKRIIDGKTRIREGSLPSTFGKVVASASRRFADRSPVAQSAYGAGVGENKDRSLG